MKTIKTTFVVLLITIFTISCNKDDDDPAPKVIDPIVGNWKLTKAVTIDPVDMNNDGTPRTNMLLEDENGCFDDCLLNLNENNDCLGLFNAFDTNTNDGVYVNQVCYDYLEEAEFKWLKNTDGTYALKRKDGEASTNDSFIFEIVGNKLVCSNFIMYKIDTNPDLTLFYEAEITFTKQ